MLRRYVHGDGADTPLVWYEGTGTGSPQYLYTDHQGSIVARTDASGAVLNINAYDEYGIPNATNTGRFQYTGQSWLPELGMYHYKARIYSPTLGRFLQTDPIGYEDQVNLYAYAGNDPVNGTDPSGMIRQERQATTPSGCTRQMCYEIQVTINDNAVGSFVVPRIGFDDLGPVGIAIGAGLTIGQALSNSSDGAETDTAETERQQRERRNYRACQRACQEIFSADPDELPGQGVDFGPRLRRCVAQCMDDMRREDEQEAETNQRSSQPESREDHGSRSREIPD